MAKIYFPRSPHGIRFKKSGYLLNRNGKPLVANNLTKSNYIYKTY